MNTLREILTNKGYNLSNLAVKEEVSSIIKEALIDLPQYIMIVSCEVKEPRRFNTATNRWLCPDATTGITICSSNRQSKECKPNCKGCVLRKERWI